jgi:hypothetical protein
VSETIELTGGRYDGHRLAVPQAEAQFVVEEAMNKRGEVIRVRKVRFKWTPRRHRGAWVYELEGGSPWTELPSA